VNYSWSPGIGLNSDTVFNPFASPDTTTTYMVTVTDSNSCPALDSVTVTVFTLPIATAQPDTAICNGDSAQLNATGGANYSWYPGLGLSNDSVFDPLAGPDTTTTYIVTITDTNGCQAKDSVTVTIKNLPAANAGIDREICAGDSIQLAAGGGAVYNWWPSAGLSDTAIADPVANPLTTTTYYVIVTDTNTACSAIDSMTLMVNPLPNVTANADPDTTICLGGSVKLVATGGGAYSWSPATALSCTTCLSPVAAPVTTTTYYINIQDGNGCVGSDSVTIIVTNAFTTTISPTPESCAGNKDGTADLTVSGGTPPLQYIWSNGDSTEDITGLAAGIYVVMITDSNGCQRQDSVVITVSMVLASAGKDTTITKGDSIILQASGGKLYLWSPGTGLSDTTIANPVAKPDETTTYYVTVTDSNGCTGVDSVTIIVIDITEKQLFIPNAFTPNGDGENDVFRITGKGIKSIYLIVYNRWGDNVFETRIVDEAMNAGWDGKHNGEEQGMAVFVYYLEVQFEDRTSDIRKGDVTLIR
ncbi:MAG: T9SS type B sorting domain-containing protein, partial [Cytophagales bacterium]|nr:T9SS type B sorting domain-containing protein [Cytophagales bacterium]